MNNIAIIPARCGSKRLKNKNILEFNGIPLIAHSIMYAKKFAEISEVIVTKDNEIIKEISLNYGAKVVDRLIQLSGDFEPTVSSLKHVLESSSKQNDLVVILQPTNPLRLEQLLSDAIKIMQDNSYDSLLIVTKNKNKFGRVKNNYFVPYTYKFGQRSQDLEPLYFENGLLYISKSELILNDKIISDNNFAFEIDHPSVSVDIDTLNDLNYAEYILKNT